MGMEIMGIMDINFVFFSLKIKLGKLEKLC